MLAGLLGGANVLKGPVGKRRANCAEGFCLRVERWGGVGPRPIRQSAHGVLIVLGTRRYTSSGMLVSPGEFA